MRRSGKSKIFDDLKVTTIKTNLYYYMVFEAGLAGKISISSEGLIVDENPIKIVEN